MLTLDFKSPVSSSYTPTRQVRNTHYFKASKGTGVPSYGQILWILYFSLLLKLKCSYIHPESTYKHTEHKMKKNI